MTPFDYLIGSLQFTLETMSQIIDARGAPQ
jgi:hypothetical protein